LTPNIFPGGSGARERAESVLYTGKIHSNWTEMLVLVQHAEIMTFSINEEIRFLSIAYLKV
jgi:hypothetical protein